MTPDSPPPLPTAETWDAGAPEETATGAPETMRVLTLRLAEELFVLDAEQVRGILEPSRITRAPQAPAFVDALINVRGAVAPLADLRVVFGMDRAPMSADARIVVIETQIHGEDTLVGLLADRVEDVAELELAAIAPPPRSGLRWPPEAILGIGRLNDDFVVLPDLDRIFAQALDAEAPA